MSGVTNLENIVDVIITQTLSEKKQTFYGTVSLQKVPTYK